MLSSSFLRPSFGFLLGAAVVLSLASLALAKPSCPPGTFLRRSAKRVTCVKCRPGTYAVLPNSSKCTPCPPNSYSSARGVRVRRACFPCPPGSVSKRGATKCTPCARGHVQICYKNRKCLKCNPGTYLDIYSCKCERCEPGSVTRGTNQLFCLSDYDRATGFAPADKPGEMFINRVNATCPPGYGRDGDEGCEWCGYNRFRTAAMKNCEECPFGRVSPSWNAPSTRCDKCPPGRYITDLTPYTGTNEQVPYCAACPTGWTTARAGRALCHRSTAPRNKGKRCPAASFETPAGDCHVCETNSRYDARKRRCVRCPKNSVSPGGVATRCSKCRPGETALVVNGQQYARCQCGDTARFVANRAGALRCARCARGSLPRESGCEPCGPGEVVRRVDGESKCTLCPAARPRVWRGRCVRFLPRCPRGFVRAPRGVRKYMREGVCVSVLTGCPRGTWLQRVPSGKLFCTRGKGRARRVVCPLEEKERYNGRDACVSCKANSILRRGAGGVWKCQACGSGTVSPGGKATKCRRCTNGLKPSTEARGACTCPAGRFVDRHDGGKCKRCPAGTFNDREGMFACKPCGRGFERTTTSCICVPGRVVNVKGECVVDKFKGPEYTDG